MGVKKKQIKKKTQGIENHYFCTVVFWS